MELMQACRQWAERPADERFWTLQEAHTKSLQHATQAVETTAAPKDLRFIDNDSGDVQIVGAAGTPAKISHYAFGQACRTATAPADFLRRLPADLAARNLNHGLAALDDQDKERQLLFHDNDGDLTLRSLTGDKYSRIWNHELLERLMPLTENGWQVPPARPARQNDPRQRAATQADLIAGNKGGLQVREGDMIAPAGVYASDHDCFVLMINPDRSFGDDDNLMRGMIWRNSEVGNGALVGLAFIFDGVCGNHIIWGVQETLEFRLRHVGNVRRRWGEARMKITKYANSSVQLQAQAVTRSKTVRLGETKDEALDYLFGKKGLDLTRSAISQGLDRAEQREDRYGDPLSAWGFIGGLTEVARDIPHGDKRAAMEMAGGKVLQQVAF